MHASRLWHVCTLIGTMVRDGNGGIDTFREIERGSLLRASIAKVVSLAALNPAMALAGK